jgi:GTP-binding protein
MLVDEVKIHVRSGDGGHGAIAFRREKYVPKGGPSGGDGGRGGDVIIKVNPSLNTLFFFQRHSIFKAKNGVNGMSRNMTGGNSDHLIIEVPPGTIIRDAETGAVLADLTGDIDHVVVVKGGRGGKGNARFATSSNRAPRMAERGAPGEERWLRLELRLIADVGLVGVPNAGKSTLLSVVSNAKPKIADYPFTTLQPNLGVVIYDDHDLVFADIPGLIEGAHMGIGLGHAFLRHVQRCRMLIHVINGAAEDPLADYNQINAELALYDEKLAQKPQIVVFNKMDLPDVLERWQTLQAEFHQRGVEVLPISALARQEIEPLIQKTFQTYSQLPVETPEPSEAVPLYQLEDTEPIFTLARGDDGSYIVTGKRIERAAAMTYWDYEEAIQRFQKILETLGISSALEKAGVQPGDTVFIGEYELEWSD